MAVLLVWVGDGVGRRTAIHMGMTRGRSGAVTVEVLAVDTRAPYVWTLVVATIWSHHVWPLAVATTCGPYLWTLGDSTSGRPSSRGWAGPTPTADAICWPYLWSLTVDTNVATSCGP